MDQATAIREGRARLKMSQEALAGASEVSVRTLIRAEQGQRVSGESLRSICAVIGVDAAGIEPSPPVRPDAHTEVSPPEAVPPLDADNPQRVPVPPVAKPFLRRLLGLRAVPLACLMLLVEAPAFMACLMGTYKTVRAIDAPTQWTMERHAARSVVAVAHAESTGTGWRRTLPSFEIRTCRAPDNLLKDAVTDILTNFRHVDDCPVRTIVIERTSIAGGVLLTVGPVGGQFGRYVARRLSGDPSVMWSVAMGSGHQARDLAWFDPRTIPAEDMPKPGDDESSWLFMRMTRATVVGEAGR